MRKLIVGLVAAAVVAVSLTVAATPAQAGARSRASVTHAESGRVQKRLPHMVMDRRYVEHVSRSEFNRAVPGMTAVAITYLFGIPGKMTYQGGGYQTREFLGWKSGDGEPYVVVVDFRIGVDSRWHLVGKSVHLPY